jgi:hypothetical protein
MKDLIVEAGRHKYGQKKKCSVKGMSQKQMEELPEKSGIRRNHTDWGFEFDDRLGPLYDFLKKNVGRKWANVWSEICEHTDSRNIRGYHLREHVRQYVKGAGGEEGLGSWRYFEHFYIDDQGVLRFKERKHYKHSNQSEKDDKFKKIEDRLFERINGCWFEVWYEKEKKSRKRWNYFLNRHEIEYYYNDIRTRQRQLSKKDLKKLGLSNN